MTVTNAFVTTYLNQQNRKSDEQRKKLAFFATLEQEIKTIREQLQTSSEILLAFKTDHTGAIQWASTVRIASRISPLRSLDHDWEKLYVIGVPSIRLLRQNALDSVKELRDQIAHGVDNGTGYGVIKNYHQLVRSYVDRLLFVLP